MATRVETSSDEIIKLFDQFDLNGDGLIDRGELGKVLQTLDEKAWSDARVDQLLYEADANADGRIQYKEFIKWLFAGGEEQARFCSSVKRIAKQAVNQVRLAAALRELDAAPDEERRQAETLVCELVERLLQEPDNPALRSLQRDSSPLRELVAVRGCESLLVAMGFSPAGGQEGQADAKPAAAGGSGVSDTLVLPKGADVRWVSDILRSRAQQPPDEATPNLAPAGEPAPGPALAASERAKRSALVPWELFGGGKAAPGIGQLVEQITALPPMNKKAMGGQCAEQTIAMEDFMVDQVGMRELRGKYFVQGVKAFMLEKNMAERRPEEVLTYKGNSNGDSTCEFRMSVGEVLEWQSSFRTFYPDDVYAGEEGKLVLQRSLAGQSEAGEEAWQMKFAIRCSRNPVIMRFDAKVVERNVGDTASANVYLISVCGIDFASRVHDHLDLTEYIKNWQDVYRFDADGVPYVKGGRDFVLAGVEAKLHVSKLMNDLKKMARLRLRAQDALGIQIAVEVGLGLGVFAGDAIGIGRDVRMLSAHALKCVLQEDKFESIKLLVLSLPIFFSGDNFDYFSCVFNDKGYTGETPVLLIDQDMHAIAIAAANAGFVVGELNPADSHGVFGEYWQNFGPGTEEKLALTTCGLLTQHHVVNPAVLDPRNYIAMDVSKPRPS